jgi:hypothetical protein
MTGGFGRVGPMKFDGVVTLHYIQSRRLFGEPPIDVVCLEAGLPKHKRDAHLLELDKRGAQAQLKALLHEVKMLIELFPDLRDSFDKDELPISFIMKRGAQHATRRKRTLSVAAKKAISEAQKKRWAKQKTAEKK